MRMATPTQNSRLRFRLRLKRFLFFCCCRILNITEAVGNTMVGYQSSYTLVAPAIAISVVDVETAQFNSLTFSVSSDPTGTKPEVSQVINYKSTRVIIS